MVKNINQSGLGILINLISYKCVQYGIIVKKINPKYSSKLCSNYSYVNH
jgi:IS605 OrfB family transposase